MRVVRAHLSDLGKFLMFVSPEVCPKIASVLNKSNIDKYMVELDRLQLGPSGRSTKVQVLAQVLKYLKGLPETSKEQYFECVRIN